MKVKIRDAYRFGMVGAALLQLGLLASCMGPEYEGSDCFFKGNRAQCMQHCRQKYGANQKKVLACQKGYNEEVESDKRRKAVFGRD